MTSDYKLIFDSGTATSVTNSNVANYFNLKFYKYNSPIKIIYANGTESLAIYLLNLDIYLEW